MLLWTIMPEEVVLEKVDQPRKFQRIQYRGKDVIVEPKDNGKGIIVQLLSTNPDDFLNEQLSPGTEILLQEIIQTK